MRCGICTVSYDLGQVIKRGDFTYYPQGESAYWKHTLSDEHQAVLIVRDKATSRVLLVFERGWDKMRELSRDFRDPVRSTLKKLLE